MTTSERTDLLIRAPLLKRLLGMRSFQPALMLISLAFFVLAILAGLFGTPVGNRNFGIIFVWVVWWALLIIILVPFFGRLWCAVCPLPAVGEWLQRGAIVSRAASRPRTLGLRWPRRLKNMWLQNFGFLGVAIFSAVILTRPQVSAWMLLGFVVLSVALSLLYEKRIFCRYVCPVGGFIGLYAMLAPIELRVRDAQVCASHRSKDCVTGNERGYGCPWLVYPGRLTRNIDCGLCTECLKTCPHDNIAINLRPLGSDLLVAGEHRLDEAYKGFIMLGSALVYSVVLLGPWGWLKSWANLESLLHWVLYALGFVAFTLIVLPVLFGLAAAVSGRLCSRAISLQRIFIDHAYTLTPLGLAAWIAFSLSFVLGNSSYVLTVLSDPFGWGWDIIGTANMPWAPPAPALIAFLQVGVLLGGLLFAAQAAYHIARQHTGDPRRARYAAAPIAAFLLIVTFGFLRLYLG